MMFAAVLLVFILVVVLYKKWSRECMSPNPMEMTMMHQGRMQRLIDQMTTVNITYEGVEALREAVDLNVQNINSVNENMLQKNSTGRSDAYPIDEPTA